MISSLKDSFTNYHTTGKAHSEASIALGQTLSQAATLFGDSHGGASELLTKAADCFNRIECYRDMMLLNQTTTMTAQSLEQIARDFEQTRVRMACWEIEEDVNCHELLGLGVGQATPWQSVDAARKLGQVRCLSSCLSSARCQSVGLVHMLRTSIVLFNAFNSFNVC